MANLNASERLALLVALDKKLQPELKLAKSEVRQHLLDTYNKIGADRMPICIGATKVGDVSLQRNRAKAAIKVEKQEEALKYLLERGLAEIKPICGWEKHFTRCFTIESEEDFIIDKDTGEVVDWAVWQRESVGIAKVNKCKPEDVLSALQTEGRLTKIDAIALLEGAQNE